MVFLKSFCKDMAEGRREIKRKRKNVVHALLHFLPSAVSLESSVDNFSYVQHPVPPKGNFFSSFTFPRKAQNRIASRILEDLSISIFGRIPCRRSSLVGALSGDEVFFEKMNFDENGPSLKKASAKGQKSIQAESAFLCA